jgi:hypothetical protein
MRWRRAVSYLLTAVIVAVTAWLTIRLSFPPDPYARRYPPASPPSTEVIPDRDVLLIRDKRQTRQYRFYRTDQGVVAREVPPDEQEPTH